MNKTIILVVVTALILIAGILIVLALSIVGYERQRISDLKKIEVRIEQTYWCLGCERALGYSDVISGYLCESCNLKSFTPGRCPDCRTERVKGEWCRSCRGVVKLIWPHNTDKDEIIPSVNRGKD